MSSGEQIPLVAPDEALARLVPVCQAVASARTEPGAAYIVGGAIRDVLLGRTVEDIDLATSSDAGQMARQLARELGGTCFPLSDEHGCWRIVPGSASDVFAGETLGFDTIIQVDICKLVGDTLESDLAARDFTINALALSVDDPGSLIDLAGGVDDLATRTVAVVSSHAFDDDPLRMIRAVRFAAELEFVISPSTRSDIAARAQLASRPAGERTFAEFSRILMAGEARRSMRQLDELKLLAVLLPELDACRGIEQSRFHHLDVFDHTLAVLDNVEDIARHPEFHLGKSPDVPTPVFGDDQVLLLKLAAITHDLGKPATHRIDPVSRRVSFVGHDTVGASIVNMICDRWATSNALRTRLRHLVSTHLELGWLLHDELDVRATWRYLRKVEPVAAEAVALSVADRLGTAGVDDRRSWVRRHVQAAHAVWAAAWHERAHGIAQPLLNGSEIAAACNLTPGPQIGALVLALAEAQATGEVQTRAQAETFVQKFDVSAE